MHHYTLSVSLLTDFHDVCILNCSPLENLLIMSILNQNELRNNLSSIYLDFNFIDIIELAGEAPDG